MRARDRARIHLSNALYVMSDAYSRVSFAVALSLVTLLAGLWALYIAAVLMFALDR